MAGRWWLSARGERWRSSPSILFIWLRILCIASFSAMLWGSSNSSAMPWVFSAVFAPPRRQICHIVCNRKRFQQPPHCFASFRLGWIPRWVFKLLHRCSGPAPMQCDSVCITNWDRNKFYNILKWWQVEARALKKMILKNSKIIIKIWLNCYTH